MDTGPNTFLTDAERARLESIRVGIAGAGGLGSNCAMHLVRAGVLKFTIADFDTVNESNLNRQFFFRDQVGRPKVDALGENLRRINPGVELDLRSVRLAPDNFAGVFAGCDILVEALDSEDAKAMFVSCAVPTGLPMVVASGIAGWGRSSDIAVKRMGSRLVVVGDCESAVGKDGLYPVSPRVGIVAAMQANAVAAILLGREI